jgi:hypothetical protein
MSVNVALKVAAVKVAAVKVAAVKVAAVKVAAVKVAAVKVALTIKGNGNETSSIHKHKLCRRQDFQALCQTHYPVDHCRLCFATNPKQRLKALCTRRGLELATATPPTNTSFDC